MKKLDEYSMEKQKQLTKSFFRAGTPAPLLAVLIVLTGCVSFPVVVKDDPFKGVTEVSVDMWHTVLDSDLDNVRTVYYRQIAGEEASPPAATFVFVATVDPYYGGYNGENLDNKAYIMADRERFTVELAGNTNARMKRNTVYYDFPIIGYHHFFYFYPGVTVRSVSNQHVLTATVKLTADIQRALMSASSYMIRFYAGNNAVTLEATPKQLEALRQFLRTGRGSGSLSK